MVIVGGMGSILGAAMGAAVIILLRHQLAEVSEYWSFYMGSFFVAMVLLASDGIYGRLLWGWRRLFDRSEVERVDVSR